MCALLLYIHSFLSRIDHTYPILVSAQKIKRIRTKQLLDPRIDSVTQLRHKRVGEISCYLANSHIYVLTKKLPICVRSAVLNIFFNFKLCKRYFTISLFVEGKKLKVWKFKMKLSMKLNDVSCLPEAMKRIPISTIYLRRTRALLLKIIVILLSEKDPKRLFKTAVDM